jgi:hypothetical protein
MKGGISTPRAASAAPYLTALTAAAAGTLTATTGFDRTVGNQFCYAAASVVAGAKVALLYSGSGTDVYTVKVWVSGVLRGTATLSITASGTYSVTFPAPVSVPAYATVSLGVRCTSSVRYTLAAMASSTYFASAAAVRLVPPCPAEPGRLFTRFATFAGGDAEPTTDAFLTSQNVGPIDPF